MNVKEWAERNGSLIRLITMMVAYPAVTIACMAWITEKEGMVGYMLRLTVYYLAFIVAGSSVYFSSWLEKRYEWARKYSESLFLLLGSALDSVLFRNSGLSVVEELSRYGKDTQA